MTPEEARKSRLCPNAALIGTAKTASPFCHGIICGAWRWANNQAFRDAVKREAERNGEKAPFSKSSATVTAKPVTFNLEGYCGLGGAP